MSIQVQGTTVIDDSRKLVNITEITLGGSAGASGQVITSQGSGAAPSWTSVGATAVITVTATTQTATAGNHYILTNVAATTLTLPATPASGATVAITPDNALATNVVARNGQTIMGLTEDMTLDNAFATVTLRFLNSSWRLI